MINDFTIKSFLSELERLGYANVVCHRLYDHRGNVEACAFMFKFDGNYFYSVTFGSWANFSFDEHVLEPIKLLIEAYNDIDISKYRLEKFINLMCFNNICFNNYQLHSYSIDSDKFFERLSNRYSCGSEFMRDFDKIEKSTGLSPVYDTNVIRSFYE